MLVLITGNAGFIGTNFVKNYLNNPDTVVGYDKMTYAGNTENMNEYKNNKNFVFIKGSINNKKYLKEIFSEYDFDAVINFAAETHVDRSYDNLQEFINTNIMGTKILLDTAKESWKNKYEQKKFIHISTDEVYGSLDGEELFTENSALFPSNPYAMSKYYAEYYCKMYYEKYGLPVVVTRSSNNYGPFQNKEKLVPKVIYNCLNKIKIPLYGDGKNLRDWLYVEDNCKAIELVLKKGRPGEIYNISSNNERENIYVIKKIIDIINEVEHVNINDNIIEYVPDRFSHDRRYGICSDKIKNELKWKPETDFETGIENTVKWYLKNTDKNDKEGK